MTDRRTAAAAATAAARTVLTHARNTLLSSVAAVRGAGQAVTEREIPAKVSTAAHTWTAANWTKIRSTAAAAPRTWPAASRNKILAAAGLVACALITMVVTAGDGGILAAAAAGPAAAPGTGPVKADPGGTRPPAPAGPADSATTTGGAPDPSHGAAPTSAWCIRAFGINCYSPRQLQQAYDLPPLYARGLDGQGRTIVVVDAYGSPTIRHDLQVFDAGCGLPGPPSLRIIQPVGRVPRYDADDQDMVDAAAETTTDVEAAHSIAPGASILLVETPADETLSGGGFAQFMAAENYVVRHGLGDVISQSFGLPEQNFGQATIRQLRYAFQNAARHHVTVLAAANDFGVTGPTRAGGGFRTQPVVDWPASDPLVTGVGGTRLQLTATGRRTAPDSAWNEDGDAVVARYAGALPWASSGGRSAVFTRPGYQGGVRGVTGGRRGVPDVALSASFRGGFLSYGSFTGRGAWKPAAGTSVATPMLAGLVAITDQAAHTRLGPINPALYQLAQQHAPGIVPVTRGSNTVRVSQRGKTVTVRGYPARAGYSLVTGVGTVDAARFVPELAAAASQP
jgi:subtilase family serine protease